MTKLEAFQLIEEIQEQVYSKLGIEPAQNRMDDVLKEKEKTFEEMCQKMLPLMPPEERAEIKERLKTEFFREVELPTRFESPFWYPLILDLKKDIEKVALDLKKQIEKSDLDRKEQIEKVSKYDYLSLSIPTKIFVGTLPGKMYATTIPSGEDIIVLFDPELFTFANLLSKIVVRAIPRGKDGDFLYSVDLDRTLDTDILRRFQELIRAYLLKGRAGAAPSYLLEGPYMALAGELTESMELFVMGHEYAHILSRHLSKVRKPFIKEWVFSKEGITKVDAPGDSEIIYNISQEFEADAKGVQLMLRARVIEQGAKPTISYLGAELLFSCIDIVERGISIVRTGEENARPFSSHPLPKDRREELRRGLKNSLPEEEAECPLEMGRLLNQFLEGLFERTRPTLRQYYENNQKLAPIWDVYGE